MAPRLLVLPTLHALKLPRVLSSVLCQLVGLVRQKSRLRSFGESAAQRGALVYFCRNGIDDRRSPAQWLPLPRAERLMTQPGPSSRSRASQAASRLADTTASVAAGVAGAAVKGVIGGIQGAANGVRDGWRKGSQSVAGRPGRAWVQGVLGGFRGAANGTRDGWSTGSQSRRLAR